MSRARAVLNHAMNAAWFDRTITVYRYDPNREQI